MYFRLIWTCITYLQHLLHVLSCSSLFIHSLFSITGFFFGFFSVPSHPPGYRNLLTELLSYRVRIFTFMYLIRICIHIYLPILHVGSTNTWRQPLMTRASKTRPPTKAQTVQTSFSIKPFCNDTFPRKTSASEDPRNFRTIIEGATFVHKK